MDGYGSDINEYAKKRLQEIRSGTSSVPPPLESPSKTRTPSSGLITPGNIDLYNRPKIKNPTGGESTVYSVSFNDKGKEVLVPRAADGRILSTKEAIDRYRKTGQHLGIFDSSKTATAYAQQLHGEYAAGKYDRKPDVVTYSEPTHTGAVTKQTFDRGYAKDVLSNIRKTGADAYIQKNKLEFEPTPGMGEPQEDSSPIRHPLRFLGWLQEYWTQEIGGTVTEVLSNPDEMHRKYLEAQSKNQQLPQSERADYAFELHAFDAGKAGATNEDNIRKSHGLPSDADIDKMVKDPQFVFYGRNLTDDKDRKEAATQLKKDRDERVKSIRENVEGTSTHQVLSRSLVHDLFDWYSPMMFALRAIPGAGKLIPKIPNKATQVVVRRAYYVAAAAVGSKMGYDQAVPAIQDIKDGKTLQGYAELGGVVGIPLMIAHGIAMAQPKASVGSIRQQTVQRMESLQRTLETSPTFQKVADKASRGEIRPIPLPNLSLEEVQGLIDSLKRKSGYATTAKTTSHEPVMIEGTPRTPEGPTVIDAPVMDAQERMFKRQEIAEQETLQLLQQERERRESLALDNVKRFRDQLQEQQEAEQRIRKLISDKRTMAMGRSTIGIENAIHHFDELNDAMDRIAKDAGYDNAAAMSEYIVSKRPVSETIRGETIGKRTPSMDTGEREFLSLWAQRARLIKDLDPDKPEPTTTEYGKERITKEAELAEREQRLREVAARLTKEEARTPEESQEKQQNADEAIRQAEDIKTEVDRQRAEREAGRAKQQTFPAGVPISLVSEGRATEVRLPDGRKIGAKYAIVSGVNLITSHNPNSFEWRPEFQPQRLQPRNYETNREAQAGVIEGGQNFDVDAVHNTDNTGHNGPPVILSDGRVAGGNGRAMRGLLAYSRGNPELIRSDLVEKAEMFGIDPDTVPPSSEKPMLVRVLDYTPESLRELIELGQDLNRTEVRGFSEAEQSVMSSERLTQETMNWVSSALDSMEENASIRDLMRYRGTELIDKMVSDGMISPTKRAEFITSNGELTEKAKDLFENALLGRVIADPDLIATMPRSIKNKLFRSLAPLSRIRSADPAWDFTDYLQEAIRNWKRIEAVGDVLDTYGKKDSLVVDKWFKYQEGKMIQEPKDHPAVEALTRLLEKSSGEVKEAFSGYADEIEGKQEGLAFRPPSNPREAFNEHIAGDVGVEIGPGEWGTLRPAPEIVEQQTTEAKPEEYDQDLREVPDPELHEDYIAAKELFGEGDAVVKAYEREFERRKQVPPPLESTREMAPTPKVVKAEPIEPTPAEKDKQAVIQKLRTSGPMTEEKLRGILAEHPAYSMGKINAAVDVWKRFAEKYVGVPFDQWLAENFAGVEVMGEGPRVPGANEVPTGILFQKFEPGQEDIIREAGGIPIGIQEGFGKHPSVALFNHPETKSTISVPLSELNVEAVRKKLAEHKELVDAHKTGEPPLFQGYGMGMTPAELEGWARKAGKKISVEEHGEQLGLFGAPERVYRLRNSSGESVLVTESQMQELRAKVPSLGAKMADGGPLQGTLFQGDEYLDNRRRDLADLKTKFESAKGDTDQRIFLLSRIRELSDEISQRVRHKRYVETLSQGKKGAVEFLEDGRALVHLMENADISTIFHEFAHVARRNLKAEDAAIVHEWLRLRPDDSGQVSWDVASEEKFARSFEKYLHDGDAPTEGLKNVFRKIRDWMMEVYEAVKGSSIDVRIPAEVRKVFDRMVSGTPEELAESKTRTEPVNRTKLSTAIEDEASRIQDIKEQQGELLTPEERLSSEKIGEGGEEFADNLTSAKLRIFPDAEQAVNWANTNRENLKGVKLYQMPDGRAFAHFFSRDPNVLFQDVDPIEIERKIRLIDERINKIIPEAERVRLGKMRQELTAQKNKKGMEFTPTPMEKPIKLWTPEGEVEVGGSRGRPDPERAISDVPAELQEPRRTGRVDVKPGQPGSTKPSGTPGRSVGRPAESKRGIGDGGEPRKALRDVPAAQLDAPAKERGTVVYSSEDWAERVKAIGMPENTPAPTVRIPNEIRRMLRFAGQPEVAEATLSGLKQHDAVVLGLPTGAGKSYLAGAVLSQLVKPDSKVLFLTTSKDLIHQRGNGVIAVLRDFDVDSRELPSGVSDPGEPGVYVSTYDTAIGRQGIENVPWDLIVFDEIGAARKWYSSKRGAMAKVMANNAKKVLYMSATPYHTSLELGHMDKLGLWKDQGFAAWSKQFGVYKDTEGNWAGGNAPKKLLKLREQLVERGQFIYVEKSLEGFDTSFAQVPLSPEQIRAVSNINKAFELAEDYFVRKNKNSMIRATRANAVTYIKKYLERSRLPQAVEMAKKLEKEGWKVIVFSETKTERTEPFDFLREADEALDGKISELLPPLPSVPDTLSGSFGDDMANYSGSHSAARTAEKDAFLDNSKKHVYVSYAAGGIGVSLHDTSTGGLHPRAVIYLGPPYSGIMFDQAIGRAWRYGTNSNVHAIFMTSNARPEINMIITKIAPRMTSLRALVNGIDNQDPFVNTLRNMDSEREKQAAYELGQNIKFDAGDFSQVENTHAIQSWKDVKIESAEKAKGKGMRMPEVGKKPGVIKLFQADEYEPPEDLELPEEREAQVENDRIRQQWEEGRTVAQGATESLPAPSRAVLAEDIATQAQAEAREGSGSPIGSVRMRWDTTQRYVSTAWDSVDGSRPVKAAKIQNLYWFTNGRKVIREVAAAAGRPEVGTKIARDLADYHVAWGNISGPWVSRYFEILKANDISSKRKVRYRDPKTGDMKEVSEHHNMVMAKQGKQPPANERIAQAVQQTTELMNDVRASLGKEGVAVEIYDEAESRKRYVPFSEIMDDPKYWPRKYDSNYEIHTTDPVTGAEEKIKLRDFLGGELGEAKMERIIKQMMYDHNLTRSQVEDFMASRHRDVPLVGNVERSREYDLPFYRTDPEVMVSYLEGAAEAMARTRMFGQQRQKLNRMISDIPNQKARARVNEIVDSVLSKKSYEDDTRALVGLVADWSVLTKMPFSALKALGHSVWAPLSSNTRSYLRGLTETAINYREARDRAIFSGAVIEQYKIEMMREFGAKRKISTKFLDLVGFQSAYKFGRIVSDSTARVYLQKYALPKLMKGKGADFYRRNLKEVYLLSDADIDRAIDTGSWSEADLNRAGKALSDKTMFTFDPSELPPAWRARSNEPIADNVLAAVRITTLLKGFMFKSGALIRERLISEAQKGNFRPWIPFILLTAGMGEIITDLNSLFTLNRKRYDELANDKESWVSKAIFRVSGDIAHATGLSLVETLLDATFRKHDPSYATRDVLEFGVGPGMADAVHTFIQLPMEQMAATTKRKTSAEKRYASLLRWLRSTFPVTAPVVNVTKGVTSGSGSSNYRFTPLPR